MLAASNRVGLPRQKLPHIYELICFKINTARRKEKEREIEKRERERRRKEEREERSGQGGRLKGFGVKKGFTYKLK